jgi:predicted Rossmann fold nucleotide-binding protein DprA/Smf involved in DNA uptake
MEREHSSMSDYYADDVSTLPLFRRTDPATSKAAAASVKTFAGEHHAAILDALSHGPAGASGIAARCGLMPHQIGKRINELARAGRIVETGRVVTSSSGRGEREWRVAAR